MSQYYNFEAVIKRNSRVPREITFIAKNINLGVRTSFKNASVTKQKLSVKFINDLAFEMDDIKENLLKGLVERFRRISQPITDDMTIKLKVEVETNKLPMINDDTIDVSFKMVLDKMKYGQFIEPFLDLTMPIADYITNLSFIIRQNQVQMVEFNLNIDRYELLEVLNTPVELFKASPVRTKWRRSIAPVFALAENHMNADFHFDCFEGELDENTSDVMMFKVDFITTRNEFYAN